MPATEQTSTQYKSSPEQSEPTFEQLLVEAHKDLDRLGPGSPNATLQALHFIEGLDEHSVLANLGCGTGGESLLLARYMPSTIIGLDMFEDFVSAFNQQALNLNLSSRVKAVVGKMEELPFEPLSLDVIWSEGVLDAPGFKAGLLNWQNYLKRGGYFAVTSPSWLTSEHPTEVEKFWSDAGCTIGSIEDNLATIRACGYTYIASFVLPEYCWMDNYYIPRQNAIQKLSEKYPESKTMSEFAKQNTYEVELYKQFHKHYGYVFYIGLKE